MKQDTEFSSMCYQMCIRDRASVFQRLLVSENTGKRKFPRDREGRKEMRLDKYLKVSRLIKRRTVANEACDAGRVLVLSLLHISGKRGWWTVLRGWRISG